MDSLTRFRNQLDGMCRKEPANPVRPLTGLEKHNLEQEETRSIWDELRSTGVPGDD